MIRKLFSIFLTVLLLSVPAHVMAEDTAEAPRASTGGAQTLEDIMARQRGEKIDDSFRRDNVGDPNSAASIGAQLGTLGGASDAETWRSLRYGSADVTASSGGDVGAVLFQDGGMAWLQFRQGPLINYGAYFMLIMAVLLLLFYLFRGKIMVDHGLSGIKIPRFSAIERFAHWLLAGSFILLGLTGLITLAGRKFLIPAFGHDVFSTLAVASKWIHNNVSWAFMIALVMIFVFWVVHNLPAKADLKWIAQGGGIFSKGKHPPAHKFNAGQKLIFWMVIILGASISASGLALLFPFELPMFAATFKKLNAIGIPQLLGMGELRTVLAPQEEMQLAQLWHAIVAFIFMGLILAHIYIGSVGMEGAFDAMGTGDVEENWAKEHHALWVDKLEAEGQTKPSGATPAE